MIGDHRPFGIKDLPVHFNTYPLFSYPRVSACIISVCTPDDVPFVSVQTLVVFGIDDGVFALCEWDASEGVAEAEAAVYKCQPHEWLYESIRDVEVNPNGLLPHTDEIRSKNNSGSPTTEFGDRQVRITKSFDDQKQRVSGLRPFGPEGKNRSLYNYPDGHF